jgi:hypothetical protein
MVQRRDKNKRSIGKRNQDRPAGISFSKHYYQSGCGGISDAKFFIPYSGKEKETGVIRIKASPNPTNGRVSLLLSEAPATPAKLAVYNRHGRVLVNTLVTGNVTNIDLLKHSKGLYYVEVNINNKKNIVPVVVQ